MCDYPSEGELEEVQRWPATDLPGWLQFIKQIGNYWSDATPWGWDEEDGTADGRSARVYHISTGGWSGNEEIIAAMRDNFPCWSLTWEAVRRGGHYTFAVPKG